MMEKARSHYPGAAEICEKLRFRSEIALTQLAALLLGYYPNKRADAIEHLDFAIGEMKTQPSLERALWHKGSAEGIRSTTKAGSALIATLFAKPVVCI
jgi:hypothetical protein